MDFDVKKLAAEAGTFFSRAVQFTEEKLGQAEKTQLDEHLESLLSRAEVTKRWTERIMKQTEVLLQPNPNVRIEGFLYDMLDKSAPVRPSSYEELGECMKESAHAFGAGTAYGDALMKSGEAEKRVGAAEREFAQASGAHFLAPLRNFLEGDCKSILKERKLLQSKRLDLDTAKARLRKAKAADARSAQLNGTPPLGEEHHAHFSYLLSFLHVRWLKMWALEVAQAETELRLTQNEFDRQAEITRLLLEGIGSTHAHHLRCLIDFTDAQTTYYAQCCQYMVDLQKQLASFPAVFPSDNDPDSASAAMPPLPPSPDVGRRKARVLYDYEAASNAELSLLADEVIEVYSVPGLDSDWLMCERGRVPTAYLELLN